MKYEDQKPADYEEQKQLSVNFFSEPQLNNFGFLNSAVDSNEQLDKPDQVRAGVNMSGLDLDSQHNCISAQTLLSQHRKAKRFYPQDILNVNQKLLMKSALNDIG